MRIRREVLRQGDDGGAREEGSGPGREMIARDIDLMGEQEDGEGRWGRRRTEDREGDGDVGWDGMEQYLRQAGGDVDTTTSKLENAASGAGDQTSAIPSSLQTVAIDFAFERRRPAKG